MILLTIGERNKQRRVCGCSAPTDGVQLVISITEREKTKSANFPVAPALSRRPIEGKVS